MRKKTREERAWRSVAGCLVPGEGTVGTKLNIEHLKATPVGMRVRCETQLVEIDRRRLVFQADVFDECEKIGTGTHERFIIDKERFIQKTYAQLSQ